MERKDPQVACSLGGQSMKTRTDEWRQLLTANIVETLAIPGGVRLSLRSSPAVVHELDRLIALESSCCAWIDWRVDDGPRLQVDATAEQEEGAALLRDWFGRAAPTVGPSGC
ncbi:MAG: hypothetical protein ABR575_05050 [Actinomycetota bacterium]